MLIVIIKHIYIYKINFKKCSSSHLNSSYGRRRWMNLPNPDEPNRTRPKNDEFRCVKHLLYVVEVIPLAVEPLQRARARASGKVYSTSSQGVTELSNESCFAATIAFSHFSSVLE